MMASSPRRMLRMPRLVPRPEPRLGDPERSRPPPFVVAPSEETRPRRHRRHGPRRADHRRRGRRLSEHAKRDGTVPGAIEEIGTVAAERERIQRSAVRLRDEHCHAPALAELPPPMPPRCEQRDAEGEQPHHADERERLREPLPEVMLEAERPGESDEVAGELLQRTSCGQRRMHLMATEQHPCEPVAEHDGGTDDRDDAGTGPRGAAQRAAVQTAALQQQHDDRRGHGDRRHVDCLRQMGDAEDAEKGERHPPRQCPPSCQAPRHEQEREAGERSCRVGGSMDMWREGREVALELGQSSLMRRHQGAHHRDRATHGDQHTQQARLGAVAPQPAPRGSCRRNVAARTPSRCTRRLDDGGTTTRAGRR